MDSEKMLRWLADHNATLTFRNHPTSERKKEVVLMAGSHFSSFTYDQPTLEARPNLLSYMIGKVQSQIDQASVEPVTVSVSGSEEAKV